MAKYVIGLDYGTLSARALLVSLENGSEVAESVFEYPHAVMGNETFANVDKSAAFQHPQDYIEALRITISGVIEKSKVPVEDIIGVGIDFTACTMLPIKDDATPLCFDEKYKDNPHAYVKLWKHHGAQAEADFITDVAVKNKEKWLASYGGRVSSEWMLPKMLETINKSPDVYNDADRYIEAGDWLVWLLTGEEVRSSCLAAYKGLWNKKDGYPSKEFMEKINPQLEDVAETKLFGKVLQTGSKAGVITKKGAELTGLCEGTAVAVPITDAHATLPAAGIVDGGKMMLIIGTSTCHIIMSKEEKTVPGICGCVADGVVPGYMAYDAGQSCVGDSFDWFVKNCVPGSYEKEAADRGMNVFALLKEKAGALKPGESGLIALDWWNGNRTPLADYDLTGAILGMTLKTKPEEIYRAIIESTAFGTKAIIDLYEENGIKTEEIYAAGGISKKDALLMQIYADVLGKKIKVTGSSLAGAKGSAIFAASASGYFETIEAAAKVMADKCVAEYIPVAENTEKYAKLFAEYKKLTDYFGRGGNNVLKNLKNI